jgi:hypothetical protein
MEFHRKGRDSLVGTVTDYGLDVWGSYSAGVRDFLYLAASGQTLGPTELHVPSSVGIEASRNDGFLNN